MIFQEVKKPLQCPFSLLTTLSCNSLILAVLLSSACITLASFDQPKEVPSFLQSLLMATTVLRSFLISYISVLILKGTLALSLLFGQPTVSPTVVILTPSLFIEPNFKMTYFYILLFDLFNFKLYMPGFKMDRKLNLLCATWP